MANDLNRSIKIYLDNSAAMTSADQLQGRIGELEKKLLDLQTAGKGNTEQAKKVEKELIAQTKKFEKYKQEVADTERVLKNLSGATYDQLINAKKKIDKQLKSTTRNTDLYNQRLQVQKAISRELIIAQKDLRTEVGCQASVWGRAADFINKYMGIIGSAVAALTGVTMAFNKLREARNKLEESKADVKALTGLNDESIEWLTKQAQQLSTSVTKEGIRIRESATEILEAYKLVGSAKPELLSNKEALAEVTEQTLILASASGMKLTDAVDAVTLAMNQYGAGANEASKYVNALAAGSKFGAVAVESQTRAIIKSGVSAASANIPLEQLIGTIETLGEKGIKDEIAGTGLKKFFLTLQTGADETNPKVVGLEKALENLKNKQMDAAAIKKMFGEEGYNVASVLINETEKVKYYTEAVTGTTVAMEQASIKSETAAAKLDQARNKMNDLGIELMEKLNPAITSVLNQTVNWTKKIVLLADWISKNTGLIITLATVLAAYTVAVKTTVYWQKMQNAEFVTSTRLGKVWTAVISTIKSLQIALAGSYALLTGNITRARAAWILLNRTMLINPFVAIGATVAALTVGIYKLATRTTEAARANKAFNDELDKEKLGAQLLFDALKRANEGTETRRRLIQTINEKYGQYLTNQLTEKSNLEEIDVALKQVNTSLEEQIGLRIKNESASTITEKFINDVADKYDYIRKEVAKQSSEDIAGMYVSDLKELIMAGGQSAYEVDAELKKRYGNVLTSSAFRDLMRIKRVADDFKKELSELDGKFAFLDKPKSEASKQETGQDNDNNGGKELEEKKSLLEIQRSLRAEAEKMPETTEAEIIAKNKLLKTIDDEISRLSKLGVEKDNSEKEEKKVTDAKLKEVDRYVQQEKVKLNESYLQNLMDKDEYNQKLEILELEALNRRLAIYGLDKDKQAEIQDKILSYKVKVLEETRKFEESQEKYRLKAIEKEKNTKEKALNDELKRVVAKKNEQQAKEFDEELKHRQKMIDIAQGFSSEIGSIVGGALSGNSDIVKSSLVSIINMGLDALKIQCQMAVAGATMQSLAQPDSVLTFGATGFARAAILTGLIEAAFSAVKAVVGNLANNIGSGGNSPSLTSTNDTSNNSGSRVVTDGFFVGGWSGDGSPFEVAGPIHKKEYVVPSFVMSEPAAMNHVAALEAMRRQKTNANPLPVVGFANGGYNGSSAEDVSNMRFAVSNGIEQRLLQVLTRLETKEFRAYVVYSDIERKKQTLDKTRRLGGKG